MPAHQLFDKTDDDRDVPPSEVNTRNRQIYHCLGCGRVLHQETPLEPPACCGQPMAPAAKETVTGPDAPRRSDADQ